MLWTTSESLHEILPRVHTPSGLAITADARIDNREELMETLGIRAVPSEISDSELILEAYRKWGQECPANLVGDFTSSSGYQNSSSFCAPGYHGHQRVLLFCFSCALRIWFGD